MNYNTIKAIILGVLDDSLNENRIGQSVIKANELEDVADLIINHLRVAELEYILSKGEVGEEEK